VIEPHWLSPEDVIYINKEVLEETGQTSFPRDRGMLESAVGKPINHFHYKGVEDVVVLATTLLFGIARNHPFEDGNKRTGLLAAVAFLEANGYTIDQYVSLGLSTLIVHVLRGALTEKQFADLLAPEVREI
jgi:death-on-curing protein